MKDTLKQLISLTGHSVDEWKKVLNNPEEINKTKKTKDEIAALVNIYSGKCEAYLEILNYIQQNEKYDLDDPFATMLSKSEKEIKNV